VEAPPCAGTRDGDAQGGAGMSELALAVAGLRPLVRDYLELTKPRLTLFVLIVVALSGWLAFPGTVDWAVLFHAVVGAGLVGGGASALNQYLERDADARMRRTRTRPIPTGRVQPWEAIVFGSVMSVLGLVQLAVGANPLAAVLAAVTLISYVGIYTPLKRVTTLNTQIGAIPGALPALIGWAAASGRLDPTAWALFLVVYLWQVPHFLSIAWLYRDDYRDGGFCMLPCVDPDGRSTGRQATLGSLALIPVSLMPAAAGAAGPVYFAGALLLGLYFLARAAAFAFAPAPGSARRLMRASLIYLPLLLAILCADWRG